MKSLSFAQLGLRAPSSIIMITTSFRIPPQTPGIPAHPSPFRPASSALPPSRPPRPPSSMMHVLCSTSSLLLRSATLIAGVQGALHCLHHPRASAAVAATCASTARAPSPASRPQSVPAGAAAIPVSISSSDSQYCLHHYPPRQQPRYQHRHDQHRRLRHRCHQCSCRRLCRRHSLLFIFC